MDAGSFESLVARLEDIAQERPRSYRLRVLALALLGYVVLVGAIVVLVAIAALLLWVLTHVRIGSGTRHLLMALAVVLGTLYFVVKSLRVRFEPPQGIVLAPRDAPELFDLIARLAEKLGARMPDRVVLSADFNASVMELPRLGVVGWSQSYLIIGLPLAMALSPEQFEAVLAHEFGHLAGSHTRLGNWIYRVRRTWLQVHEELSRQSRSGSSGLVERFLDWYAPFFGAYSFVFARQNEYEADRTAARLTANRHIGDALVSIAVAGRVLENRFWPQVFQQADSQPAPPTQVIGTIATALRTTADESERLALLAEALREKTGCADTHPALTERLAALGCKAHLPEMPARNAAEHLGLNRFGAELDRQWREGIALNWQERHRYVRQVQQQLAAWRGNEASLTAEQALQQVLWVEEFEGASAALAYAKTFVERFPERNDGHFTLGRLLCFAGNPAGIANLERAMTCAPQLAVSCCQIAAGCLQHNGQSEEAHAYQQRAGQYAEHLEQARSERESLERKTQLLPHDQPQAVLDSLKKQLRAYRKIKEVYFGRKRVNHFPDTMPLFVLGVVVHRTPTEALGNWLTGYFGFGQSLDAKCTEMLAQEVTFPGETFVVVLNDTSGSNSFLTKQFKSVSSSRLF